MVFGKSVVLCSEFNATLTNVSGDPVAGVPIERTWEWAWNGNKGQDKTVTDTDGRFSFPEVVGKSWSAGLLPHSPSIKHSIYADGADGKVLLILIEKKTYKRDAELVGTELTGPGVNVVCRIDKEPSDEGVYWGTCVAAQ